MYHCFLSPWEHFYGFFENAPDFASDALPVVPRCYFIWVCSGCGLTVPPPATGQLVSNVQWLSPALSQALPGPGLGGTKSHPRLTLTQVVLFAMNYSLFVLIRSPLCPQVHRTQLLSHFNWSLGIRAGLPKDVTKNQDPGYPSRSRYNTGGCRSQECSWRLESRVSLGIVVGMSPPPLPPRVQKGSQWSPTSILSGNGKRSCRRPLRSREVVGTWLQLELRQRLIPF